MRLNDQIRISPVRLIDENNNQVGIVDLVDAKNKAFEAGLDLVEIAPEATPPVCRVMDFGKYLFEQKRKTKQSQKKQHKIVLKEIRLRPKIDPHDLETKVNHARKFIEKGYKVQFTMMFRGREMLHIDQANEIMEQVLGELGEAAKLERPSIRQGRRMTMVVVPQNH